MIIPFMQTKWLVTFSAFLTFRKTICGEFFSSVSVSVKVFPFAIFFSFKVGNLML